MKFFTPALVGGELSDDQFESAFSSYSEHLTAISTLLPEPVAALANLPLQDALIERVAVNPAAAFVQLVLIGGDLEVGYERIAIDYSGARLLSSEVERFRSIATNPESELLYDELDVSESGEFVHRFLFTPEAEVSVHFHGVKASRSRSTNRAVSTEPAQRFTAPGAV